jgi:hypothetical protein
MQASNFANNPRGLLVRSGAHYFSVNIGHWCSLFINDNLKNSNGWLVVEELKHEWKQKGN